MKKTVYILALLFMFMFESFTYAVADDDLPFASLIDIFYSGSGCPNASAEAILSDDNKTLSIISQNFGVSVDETTDPVVSRFCNMNVLMHIPYGWQCSIAEMLAHSGNTKLDEGVEAKFTERYYFSKQKGLRATCTIKGPKDTDYTFVDKFDSNNFLWSPCSRDVGLNLCSTIQLNNSMNRSGFGVAKRKSTDIDIKLIWRRCVQ